MHTQQPTPARAGTYPNAVMVHSLWASPAARCHARRMDTRLARGISITPSSWRHSRSGASSAARVVTTAEGAPAPGLR